MSTEIVDFSSPSSSFSPHPSSFAPAPLPVPNAPISVRVGTREDIPFIDALQKQSSKALGFFPRAQLEGYVENGWALVAEATKEEGGRLKDEMNSSSFSPHPSPFLGYILSRDRYLKRDELGVIYQMCVTPAARRSLVAATLLKETFARSAYGCRLYCCWCAQDLAANRFWEAMGFQAIAFRGGGRANSRRPTADSGTESPSAVGCRPSASRRVHIFWQKRIRAGDVTTPWWFPAKTEGGAMREDRIVLPIPPGVRWDAAMPVMVGEVESRESGVERGTRTDERSTPRRAARRSSLPTPDSRLSTARTRRPSMQFGPPGMEPIVEETAIEKTPVVKVKRAKAKVDPKLINAARELRDRYLERVNDGDASVDAVTAKYDVSRAIEDRRSKTRTLPMAA